MDNAPECLIGCGPSPGSSAIGLARVRQNRCMPSRPSDLDPAIAARLKRDDAGLVAAVVQQHDTGEVLMVGWMDD